MTFTQEIEQELDWRINELDLLKHQIESHTNAGSGTRTALLRAAWAILYAHYEGFCKRGFRLYLGQLAAKGLPLDRYRHEILIFALRPLVSQLGRSLAYEDYYDFMRFGWGKLLDRSIEFEKDDRSDEYKLPGTQNLWPALLEENCRAMGLPTKYVTEEWPRLYLLVDRRNHIAHGESEAVEDLAQYRIFERATTRVMTALGLALIEAVENETYLRPTFDFADLTRFAKMQTTAEKCR